MKPTPKDAVIPFGFMLDSDIILLITHWVNCMNRRKKGNQILKARAKKANAKSFPSNKPKYISKADREKLAAEASDETSSASENGS